MNIMHVHWVLIPIWSCVLAFLRQSHSDYSASKSSQEVGSDEQYYAAKSELDQEKFR